MNKTITIKSVEVAKEGTNEKTGNKWQLLKVICEGDSEMKEFTTFDDKYVNSQGQQMQDNFSYNEKFRNWQVVSQKQEAENSKHDEVMKGMRSLYEIVDRIEVKVDSLVNK